ncbi:hypothetical protein [Roseibium sp. M-1]
MAHSLFEPAPEPFAEKLWRRVKDLNLGFAPRPLPAEHRPVHTDPALMSQAERLDARGRQQLLEAALAVKPIVCQSRRALKRTA